MNLLGYPEPPRPRGSLPDTLRYVNLKKKVGKWGWGFLELVSVFVFLGIVQPQEGESDREGYID